MNPPATQETPVWFPGLGRSPGEGIRLPTSVYLVFPSDSEGKESSCNARDLGSIPGLGIPWKRAWLPIPVFWPGEFHGIAKSQTQLSSLHFIINEGSRYKVAVILAWKESGRECGQEASDWKAVLSFYILMCVNVRGSLWWWRLQHGVTQGGLYVVD